VGGNVRRRVQNTGKKKKKAVGPGAGRAVGEK